jgi:hypothetical protein
MLLGRCRSSFVGGVGVSMSVANPALSPVTCLTSLWNTEQYPNPELPGLANKPRSVDVVMRFRSPVSRHGGKAINHGGSSSAP